MSLHTYAQKPETTPQAATAQPTASIKPRTGQGAQTSRIQQWQHTLGNQAVLQIRQAKRSAQYPLAGGLRISQPGDSAEIEADRLADAVVRNPVAVGRLTSTPATIGRKIGSAERAQSTTPSSPTQIQAATISGGRPLDAATREFFEPRLGRDLGDVRIHTGSTAEQSARAIDARAYAFGTDIVFGRGEYQPESDVGKRLIAHELAHVVQADNAAGGQGDVIHRQPAGNGGDLAAIDYEIQMLSQMPVMGPEAAPVMMRLAQLEQQRAVLLAQGVGAPAAPTVVCTDQDRALNVSKWRNTCLTVNQRWAAFKASVDEAWNREDDYGRKLAAVADWNDYVTQEEFDRLDPQRSFHNRYDQYLKFYAGGGQYERYQREREAAEKQNQPSPPAQQPAAADAFDFTKMRQIDIDRMQQQFQHFGSVQQPEPTPVKEPETGCHTDPYARQFGGASTVCGYKRPDAPTQATQKALQELMTASDEFAKQNRAMLDRLNTAYLNYQVTGLFPQSREFSPFEIEQDRIISVQERWDLANGPDPNNLEAAEFDERFFRSTDEYDAERERRYNEYLRTLKDCGQSRPSHFVCRDKVMGTYFPGAFALYDAAARRAYHDMEVAMPVLREGGPVAGFVFHATHEWLGWSTERSAAAANLASGVSNLAGGTIQRVAADRNAARAAEESFYGPAPMTTPPSHVASAPEREPLPQPGAASAFGPGRAADRLAGTVPRPVDVTNRSAFPAETDVRAPAPSIDREIEQAEQRYDRLRQKAALAEADYARSLRPTTKAKQRRGEEPTEQETALLRTKAALAQQRDAAKTKLDDLRAQLRAQQSVASGPAPNQVGLKQEAVYVNELQARGLAAQLVDPGTPVIDAAVVGTPEVHSVKSVVKDADAAVRLADRGATDVLAKRVSSWITTALQDRGSDKWSRLRNQWNTTKRSTYADHYGYELPKNPDEVKFVVTVRVVSASVPSASAQQAVEAAVRTWLSQNRWRIPPNFSWQIEYTGH